MGMAGGNVWRTTTRLAGEAWVGVVDPEALATMVAAGRRVSRRCCSQICSSSSTERI
jgi:hypothetical protein